MTTRLVRAAAAFVLAVVVVVVGLATRTRDCDVARARSFRGAADASVPVNVIPVTKVSNMRFVFISLCCFLKIGRGRGARVSLF